MAMQFLCSDTAPVVQTKAGKIRGFQADGTYTFHGIKYADAQRFQAPKPVQPWEGIKDAIAYGYVCPLLTQDVPNAELLVPHRYWPMDEHCQYLNIWTGSLEEKAKKPVMVWLHGGGFTAGSSIEQVAYEGDHLSRWGDVVVVTLNHRLNILGYLNLEEYGEKYQNSGNAGNADLIVALSWIHENIEAFGGDPDNVTLFGQSGGGMKVWSLMNTPAADGLFQKGIIQSGVIDGFMAQKTDGTAIVNALLEELGIDRSDIGKLETEPYAKLAAAYNKVSPALMMQGEYVGGMPIANEFYVGDPRAVGFTEHAKTIPVMAGSVFGEFDFAGGIPDKAHASKEMVGHLLEKKFGAYTDQLLQEFARAYPGKIPADLLSLDPFFRIPTSDFIRKKACCQQAATYSYLFTYEFSFHGGKNAWHCSEIPFIFHNTDRVPICNIPGVSDRLEEQMCGAWVNFARYGTPQIPGLPKWEPCSADTEEIMIFDVNCRICQNHDRELMELLAKTNPVLPFLMPREEDEDENFILH